MSASLDELEAQSVRILREAQAGFESLGLLWSMGKDSTVLLWLVRKAFLGEIPFPVLHIDTGYKLPEMLEFRREWASRLNLDLRILSNQDVLESGMTFPEGRVSQKVCCASLKTRPLVDASEGRGQVLRRHPDSGEYTIENAIRFSALIIGLRADEEGSRSKERIFSRRFADSSWDVTRQTAEFWNFFQNQAPEGGHVRVHPLLDWREQDIWRYIEREGIEVCSLYYDQGEGRRYRSLGCQPCTHSIDSRACNPGEVLLELSSGRQRGIQ